MDPSGGRLSRLRVTDRWEIGRFLSEHLEHNVYLLAQLERGALERESIAGPLVGWWVEGVLKGVACCGSNLVLSHPCPPECAVAVAGFVLQRGYLMRVIVGTNQSVGALMTEYGHDTRPIALDRPGQVLYRVDRTTIAASPREPRVRQGQLEELELLVETDVAMVREELGLHVFEGDLEVYRLGWMRRIREGRSWVIGRLGQSPIFKAEESAVSKRVIQVAGVYTAPDHRRQGWARRGVGEVCHRLLESVECVTLYVARDNRGAQLLYESLGFRPVGEVRSVWFGDF